MRNNKIVKTIERMELKIRKCSIRDSKYLAEIDEKAFKEMNVWSLQNLLDFKRQLKKYNYCAYIIEYGENIIGYIDSEYDSVKEAVWIKNIYVLPAYRKNDVGRELISALQRYWKKKTDLFILLTADRNVRIFEKLGFIKTMNYMIKKIR